MCTERVKYLPCCLFLGFSTPSLHNPCCWCHQPHFIDGEAGAQGWAATCLTAAWGTAGTRTGISGLREEKKLAQCEIRDYFWGHRDWHQIKLLFFFLTKFLSFNPHNKLMIWVELLARFPDKAAQCREAGGLAQGHSAGMKVPCSCRGRTMRFYSQAGTLHEGVYIRLLQPLYEKGVFTPIFSCGNQGLEKSRACAHEESQGQVFYLIYL